MTPVNVSAVSYLNTKPFLYGLKKSIIAKSIKILLAPPAQCVALFESGDAEISLTPVAAIPFLPSHVMINDYCIGATSQVRTVAMFSNTQLENINTIYIDPHSRTSSILLQILAKRYWKINPMYVTLTQAAFPLKYGEGCLLIGDKVFSYEQQFLQRYDLAEAWIAFTGKPFVFAAWLSRLEQHEAFLHNFKEALSYGITHISKAIAEEAQTFDAILAMDYLTNNISYLFDDKKQEGLALFLEYMKTL